MSKLCSKLQASEGSPEAVKLAREAAGYMLEATVLYQSDSKWERALEAIQKAAKCVQILPQHCALSRAVV